MQSSKNRNLVDSLTFADFEAFFSDCQNQKQPASFLAQKTSTVMDYIFGQGNEARYDVEKLEHDFLVTKRLRDDGRRYIESLDEGIRVNGIEAIEAALSGIKPAPGYAKERPAVYLAIETLKLIALYQLSAANSKDGNDVENNIAALFEISQGLIAVRNWTFSTPTNIFALMTEKRASGARGAAKRDAAKNKLLSRFIRSRQHGELATAKSDRAAARAFMCAMTGDEKERYRPYKPTENPRDVDRDGLIERSLLRALVKLKGSSEQPPDVGDTQ